MTAASASSFLFYGIFVTLPSLLIAVNAHAKLSSPLLAVKLISLRLKAKKLVTGSGCGTITRMTPALWSLVQAELEDMAWIEAEHELVLSVRVNSPYCDVECEDYVRSGKCPHFLTWDGLEGYNDESGEMDKLDVRNIYSLTHRPFHNMSEDASKKVLAFMEGLPLKLITQSDFLYEFDDIHEVYPLVPLGIRSLKHKCAGNSEDVPFAAVTDVSALSAAFSKYSDVSGQGESFVKVVQRFRFDARDPDSKVEYEPRVWYQGDPNYAEGFASWYMWTQGYCDW